VWDGWCARVPPSPGYARSRPRRCRATAVGGVGLFERDASLEVGGDLVEGVAQRAVVGGEHQHEYAERTEHEEVKRAVDRDQAQRELVAQRLASQRQLDLATLLIAG
jgi:hypothetical protein